MAGVAQAGQSTQAFKHGRIVWREAGSWVLYDVANTVYAATLTFLLSVYVKDVYNQTLAFGVTQTLSMVLSGLSVPLMAAIADKTGRSRAYLVSTTLVCIGALAAFSLDQPLWLLMVFFGIANFCYNTALVFYNSLLPSVAPDSRAGLVSGLGVGLGYLGTLLTLVALLPLKGKVGAQTAFAAAAGLFLVLALPCMLLVKERRVTAREPLTGKLISERFGELVKTIAGLRRDKRMACFLIGNFLCVDVINTAILFFMVYSLSVFGGQHFALFGMDIDLRLYYEPGKDAALQPGEFGFSLVLGGALNVLALVAGVLLGWLADKWGTMRVMRLSAICLTGALVSATLFAGSGLSVEQQHAARKLAESGADGGEWEKLAQESGAAIEQPGEKLVSAQQEKLDRAPLEHQKASIVVPSLVLSRPADAAWRPVAFVLALAGLGAMGLAGVWTAGRKVLMELAPRERLGEYFGLYGITIKLSVIGSTVFAAVFDGLGARTAMLSLVPFLVLGLVFLAMVKMPPKPVE